MILLRIGNLLLYTCFYFSTWTWSSLIKIPKPSHMDKKSWNTSCDENFSIVFNARKYTAYLSKPINFVALTAYLMKLNASLNCLALEIFILFYFFPGLVRKLTVCSFCQTFEITFSSMFAVTVDSEQIHLNVLFAWKVCGFSEEDMIKIQILLY